jgi:hypothetical protein
MKREVVQDFLNLPGIAGVALMDGRSRPYFCGVDQSLNTQQKEALAQGIRQVVETTPEGFESFEFQFTGHQVYIYKLEHGIILLVLTRSHLVLSDYIQAVERLKVSLQEDITNAIATFRLLASNITLSSQTYWKQRSDTSSTHPSDPATTTSSNTSATNSEQRYFASPSIDAGTTGTVTGSHNNPSRATSEPLPTNHETKPLPPVHPIQPAQEPAAELVAPATVTLKELLVALNDLSQFTTQYLGTAVITNYWKASRPDTDWLNNFQVDRSAQITFAGSVVQTMTQPIDSQQQAWIQAWVAAFIQRCARVIRDFPDIVEQKALSDQQKALLLQ